MREYTIYSLRPQLKRYRYIAELSMKGKVLQPLQHPTPVNFITRLSAAILWIRYFDLGDRARASPPSRSAGPDFPYVIRRCTPGRPHCAQTVQLGHKRLKVDLDTRERHMQVCRQGEWEGILLQKAQKKEKHAWARLGRRVGSPVMRHVSNLAHTPLPHSH